MGNYKIYKSKKIFVELEHLIPESVKTLRIETIHCTDYKKLYNYLKNISEPFEQVSPLIEKTIEVREPFISDRKFDLINKLQKKYAGTLFLNRALTCEEDYKFFGRLGVQLHHKEKILIPNPKILHPEFEIFLIPLNMGVNKTINNDNVTITTDKLINMMENKRGEWYDK